MADLEKIIKAVDIVKELAKQPQIVRCKECKHNKHGDPACPLAGIQPDNWYCAGGERRDDNA